MKTGVIAGNFDVIHPGYIKMFEECKENCDYFVVLLHFPHLQSGNFPSRKICAYAISMLEKPCDSK
jgi:nicotinic acid mononucleotide adenylyltransferase